MTGVISATDSGSCSAEQTINEVQLFSTCDAYLRTISPDGKHVLATQPYLDGVGDTVLAVFQADGKKVLDLTAAGQLNIRSMVWEDGEHVLALVADGNEFGVIRFGLDGTRELALGPDSGLDDMTPPFMIPTV